MGRVASVLMGMMALGCGDRDLWAQIGDKPGEAQTPIVPRELIPAAPARTAAEEAKTFRVAPGYRVELVASDPLIGDPVAMAFGPDGRLWVVEMRGYMPDLEGSTEDRPEGRVVVLSDSDGDGVMDKAQVFLEGIVLPRAIGFARDGVLVGAPPHLWFCRDTDGDGKADERTEVATDFGVRVDPARPQLANPERAPNALLWGMDNWLYVGQYAARFRFEDGVWQRGMSTFRGQWGLSQDDWGHLFHNSNSDQLRVDVLPSHYLARNSNLGRATGTNWKAAEDQRVWPVRVNPGINRGYRPEMLHENKLKEFTAACAPWIYRGDLFPEDAYGNAFVCEPAGNLIKRNRLSAKDGVVLAEAVYADSEFLASSDERFRPVNLMTGPEGALYVADLYRGVIQHRISLTSYLRKQIEDRGLDKPVALGRIWRIVPEGKVISSERPLSSMSPREWVEQLGHSNAWRRETAQRLLVERGDRSLVPVLAEWVAKGGSAMGRVHALCTLDGLKAADWSAVSGALADADPRVRAAAVRISESLLRSDQREAVLEAWQRLARKEMVPEVQLQLALSMGEAADSRVDEAGAALCGRAGTVAFLVDAFASGLKGRELELAERLLGGGDSGSSGQALLKALVGCVWAERNPERVDRMLDRIASIPEKESPIREGLLGVLATHPSVNAKRPVRLAREPQGLIRLASGQGGGMQKTVGLVRAALEWPGKVGLKVAAVRALTVEEQGRFESGKQTFLGLCAACHQPTGKGLEGLAPPLADSEWVTGPVERTARIVMHGVRGPLRVKEQGYNLDMPAAGFLSDEQIAGVLTYLRREWGHEADPVSVGEVQRIRKASAGRQDAWTEPELLKIQ
jgi:mono/diheme cytochrome c family protein/glucose/arabinose dehydrogenase